MVVRAIRDGFCLGLVTGLVTVLTVGCKQKTPVPVQQPVVRTVPRVAAPMPVDPEPDEDTMQSAPVAHRARHTYVAPMARTTPVVDEAAAEEAQRVRDARLLEQQQAASQRQQKELDQTVQQSVKATQQMQNEPRIQSAPGPAQDPNVRIQDAPGPTQDPNVRIQDAPGPAPGDAQGIQDAPGPAQTNQPAPQPAQPQGPQ